MTEGAVGSTLQQRVRAARKQRHKAATVHVPVPGYGGLLVGRYQALDWQTRVDINMELEGKEGRKSELMWTLASGHLIASCDGMEAVADEETIDLGMTYGPQLGEWLGIDMTDIAGAQEAIALIIEDGEDLIEHFGAVRQAQSGESAKIDESLAGESPAAS